MQTHLYNVPAPSSQLIARIAVETLRYTKELKPIDLEEISRKAETSAHMTGRMLRDFMGIDEPAGKLLSKSGRLSLALKAACRGALPEVARALTWQEFEAFSTECLSKAGFQTQKGLVFNDGERRWQIDLVARRNPMILAIDCKHWQPPNYSSKYRKAAEHQRLALNALLHHWEQELTPSFGVWWLPVILTLFEPRQRIIDEVVLISVGQLPDFIEHVTPYDEELPFVPARNSVESSIS